MFYFALLITFILDQAIKYFVTLTMTPNQSLPLIKNIFHFTYVQNRGAAFGLFYGNQFLLVFIGVVLIAIIFYYYFQSCRTSWVQIPLGLMIGGSLGNIFDRVTRHFVVDYLDFRFWPVFNLADIMINVGVFLIVMNLLLNKEGSNASGTY